jgi:Reverse transcriptase (RNA-dependent DNA polymerase)
MCTIHFGVPQGSVLGPLLFFSYINDIGIAVPSEKVKLFADDTNLFVSCSSISSFNNNVNTCMKLLNDWFVANQLSKTWCMVFPPNQRDKVETVVDGFKVGNVSH